MTPSSIENAARRRLNAVGSDFWSSAEIIEDLLYFACVDLSTRAMCIEETTSTSSVIGTSTYAFPSTAFAIKQISYDNQKLERMAERQFFSLNLTGTTSPQGRPTHYYEWESQYILFPTPDEVKTIVVRSFDIESALTSASTLRIPAIFHPRLVNGVCHYMVQKEVDDPRIPYWAGKWESDLNEATAIWRRKKYADKNSRVLLEEELLTTDTGII